jgi:hydroxymethylglutaryl-CoA lyase
MAASKKSALLSQAPARLFVNDVAVRDGFQSEARFVPTEDKIRLVDRLSKTGLAKIEVTSFVSPKAIPNLSDAEEVMRGITRVPGVTYVTLVPNERGCERALACAADEINLVMSVGEAHNLANMRMSCEQSLEQFRRVMTLTRGTDMKVNGSIATAFGCPFEGDQPVYRVLWAAEQYLGMGMDSITLADTTGMAHPRQVADLCRAFTEAFPRVPLTLHFHNTRGMGLANALAGVSEGVASFDASLGGIGGCPYAPGATGNICTEDLVHMMAACGLETGVDLDALLGAARTLPELLGHPVPGHILQAGKRTERHPRPLAA